MESQITFNQLLDTADYTLVRRYLKSSKYLSDRNKCTKFFKSHLPTTWFGKLSAEPFFGTLLINYFKGTYTSNSFIKLCIGSKSFSVFSKALKHANAFNKNTHWESFEFIKNASNFRMLYKELSFVKQKQTQIKASFEGLYDSLDHLPEDIILKASSILFSDRTIHYKNQQGQIWSLRSQFFLFLNRYLLHRKTESDLTQKTTQETPNSKHMDIVWDVFQKWQYQHDAAYQLNKYLSGYAQFESIDTDVAFLLTNKEHSNYRKTLSRGQSNENYLRNKVIENTVFEGKNIPKKQLKLSILTSIAYFESLQTPLSVSLKGQHIDLKKCFNILWTFSYYTVISNFVLSGKSITASIPTRFSKLFTSRGPFVVFDVADFTNSCAKAFGYTLAETQQVVDFLTTDFNVDNKKIDLKWRPFVKLGTTYFWLAALHKDTNWEVTMQARLSSENVFDRNAISKRSEQYLAQLFTDAGFKSTSGFKYETKEGKTGEIDLLVYKNGALFIGELKSTYLKEDMRKTTKEAFLDFENKGGEQLTLAQTYVNNNTNEIRTLLDLVQTEHITEVYTLLISDVYQDDHENYQNAHVKVSQLELEIILKNDLHRLRISKMGKIFGMEDFDWSMSAIHAAFDTHKNKTDAQIPENSCNLWLDKSDCTPQDIIDAIKEDKVWKHQEESFHYPIEEIEIKVT